MDRMHGEREEAWGFTAEERKAYEAHNLSGVAWHYLFGLRVGITATADFAKSASAAAAIMRVILAKGEEPEDREAILKETATIGGILHGIPPRDEEHWAIAEQLFDKQTIAELRKWRPETGWFMQPGVPADDKAAGDTAG